MISARIKVFVFLSTESEQQVIAIYVHMCNNNYYTYILSEVDVINYAY